MAKEGNPFVGIAGVIGGISIGIIAVFMVFSPVNVSYSVPIVGFLALMGIFLGFSATKKK